MLLTRRFHGTVSSIEVRDGLEMIAFRYRWNQRDPVVLTGQNPELGGWDNRILSFALTANIPLDQRVCFYSRANYAGNSFCLSEDHPALTWGRYNGYRSIRIPQGMDITTYYSGSYQGAANSYASDVPVVASGATRVDSVRIRGTAFVDTDGDGVGDDLDLCPGTPPGEIVDINGCSASQLNDPPLADDQSVTTDEDTPIAITLSGSDPDGDALSFAVQSQPSNGTLSGTAPDLSYTPSADFNGTDTFTFLVNDGLLDSNTATVSITVNSVNDAPLGDDQSVTTDEDTPVAITLSGSDPDGDALSFVVQSQPSNGTLSGTAPDLSYTPNADFNGADTFTFIVNDGLLDSNTATVSITINPVNDAPSANDQSVTTDEDTPVAITLSGSDPDGDALSFVVQSQPTNGTLSGTAPDLIYTPNADFNGTDSFTFLVNDGALDSNTATVSITVNPLNDAPLANDQSVTTDEDAAIAITLSGSDPDGDALSFVVQSQPSHGSLSGIAPDLSYTPNADFNGTDTFTFLVNDGALDSNIATVSITVNPVNDAPIANDQSATTVEDIPIAIILGGSDPDGDALSFVIQSQPSNGVLSGTPLDLTYTANAGFIGSDKFTFIVNDGLLDSNIATVSIEVLRRGMAPEFISEPNRHAVAGEDYVYDIDVADNDDPITFSLNVAPDGMSIDPQTGAISWIAPEQFSSGLDSDNHYCKATALSDTGENDAFADVTVIMDYSGSMSGEWEWVEDLVPSLEAGLLAEGIGSNTKNYYGLKETAYDDRYNDSLLMDGQLLNTYDKFVHLANRFRGADDEAGWEGINYVLDNYPLRENAAQNFILVTDEPEQSSSNYGYTYDSILQRLLDGDVVLNAVLEIQIKCAATEETAFGMDANGVGYVADGNGEYSYCPDADIVSASGNTKERYVNLALATGGAVWAIGELRSGGLAAVSFSKALQEIKVDEITKQLEDKALADIAAANVSFVANQLTLDLGNRGLSTTSAGQLVIESSVDGQNWRSVDSFPYSAVDMGVSELVTETLSTLADDDRFLRIEILPSDTSDECNEDNHQITLARVQIRAENKIGEASQSYWIATSSNNNSPTINSTPPTTASIDNVYFYQLEINDDVGDDHFVELLTAPEGMRVDRYSGLLRWRPNVGQAGVAPVSVQVTDLAGESVTQDYELAVTDSTGSPNDGPTFKNAFTLISFDANQSVIAIPELIANSELDIEFELLTGAVVCSLLSADTPDVSCAFEDDRPIIRLAILKAEDQYGRYALQTLVISRPPVFHSTPEPLEILKAEKEKSYSFSFSDPDGDETHFDLVTTLEGVVIEGAGHFKWQAPASLIGQKVPVTVRAVDQYGAFDVHTFEIQVVFNQAPTFTSDPIIRAVEGRLYRYQMRALDLDRDALSYTIVSAPSGAEINYNTYLEWEIPAGTIGTFPIEVRVTDESNEFDSQSFDLVVEENVAPIFTSTPITEAAAANQYRYRVVAEDANDDRMTYSLIEGPDGMTLSGSTLIWTPMQSQAGISRVTVRADDGFGLFADQSFEIVVNTNQAPEFTSTPSFYARVGDGYRYRAEANDPEGSSISYRLGNAPNGMTISGSTVIWTPTVSQLGEHEIEVIADDRNGATTTQRYILTVVENLAPEFTSTPVVSIIDSHNYFYGVRATDPDGDYIYYSLQTFPESMTISGSSVRWTPSAGQVGVHDVVAIADDRKGGVTEQVFQITVITNKAPEFVSAPLKSVVEKHSYYYRVTANDPDDDYIAYSLAVAPDGMTISGSSVRWTPTSEQIGTHSIEIVADDRYGKTASQSYQLEVIPNLAPLVVDEPATGGRVGTSYYSRLTAKDPNGDSVSYRLVNGPSSLTADSRGQIRWDRDDLIVGTHLVQLEAFDQYDGVTPYSYELTIIDAGLSITKAPNDQEIFDSELFQFVVEAIHFEGDRVNFEFTQSPAGATIDFYSGEIQWTPAPTQKGVFDFTVRAFSNDGLEDFASFTLTVGENTNQAPLITSTPVTTGLTGTRYEYQTEATDAENHALSYSLSTAPSGMKINPITGFIWWDVSASASAAGTHPVAVRVTDERGKFDEQSYDLVISLANLAPRIISQANTAAKVGYDYRYQTEVSDANGDVLNYQLSVAPEDMTVNAAGLIQWAPIEAGVFPVELVVSDGEFTDAQLFQVVVNPELPALSVVFNLEPPIVNADENVRVDVGAMDNTGKANATLTLDGVEIVSRAVPFSWYLSSSVAGVHSVEVTIEDDYQSASDSATFRVRDPGDGLPPVVSINNIIDDQIITAPIDIFASVDDGNLANWQLILKERSAPATEFTVLAEGSNNFSDQVVYRFDPSMSRNGQYVFILLAQDLNGQQGQAIAPVIVDEDLKVGNFSVTFEDLNLPLAGIPISVRRTYDSRDRSKQGDFGYGWSLDYQNVTLEESRTIGNGWQQTSTGVLIPTWCIEPLGAPIVTVTLPDGDVEQFEASADPRCTQVVPQNNVSIVFDAVGDTQSKLVALDNSAYYANDILQSDITDPTPADPDQYQLTTRAGYVYRIDQNVGLLSVTDPNGNYITYSQEGIAHSDGKSVSFTRDDQGRIVKMTDPMGQSLNYEYDANGDLLKVAERDGAETTFSYNLSHGLIDIMDPLGRNIVRNIYNDQGRLIAQEDSEGNRTEFNHDIEGRQSVVTDRNGNITQVFYDDEGNVTSVVDALGNTSGYSYDANGNQLSETNALGFQTTATFNARNDQLTQTDALGHVTTFEYNDRGSETIITDARGNAFENAYDANNNLTSITDPLGNVATNSLNRQGLPTEVTDVLGNSSQISYDLDGYTLSETDSEGNVVTYTRDDNGNTLTETRSRLIEGVETEETTTYEYDERDRVIKTIDALGNETETEYDLVGNEIAQIDALGRRTEMEYDSYRRLLSTTYADGTTSRNSYDAEGNLLTETDRLGRVTQFEYDVLNRLIKTTQADGSVISSEYDAIGRVVAEVDANGNRTSHEYDAADRRSKTIDALGNETTFAYDADGNMISMTDARGNTTSYIYNALDQKVQTTFADTSNMQDGLDALSRRISQTDQAGVITNYEYDTLSRLVKVIDALSGETKFSYDSYGNKLAQIDAEGRVTTWTYDALGRIASRTLSMGQSETMLYNEVGNMVEHVDFKGQTTTHSYDVNDRLTESVYADVNEAFIYDALGNRTESTKTENGITSTWQYAYDSLNRLSSETQFVGTADEVTLAYQYDAAGNRTEVTETKGALTRITRYTYDALNRLQTVQDADGNTTTYTYDAVGNRSAMTHANGTQVDYVFDELNRLTDLSHQNSGGVTLKSYSYSLLPNGKRSKIEEANGRTSDYQYDDLYRLTSEAIFDPINASHNATYTYDKVGNRTFEEVNGVSTAYTYNDNDWLLQTGGTTYTHDANGNTESQTLDSVVTTYTYNAKNELIGSDEAGFATAYLYNVDGVRVGKGGASGQALFTIDSNRNYAQVIAEHLDGTETVSYVYGDDLISQARSSGINFYHYDGLGSTRALSDGAGTITDEYDYDAFGEVLNQTGTTENDYLFTGEQFDTTLDQYYLRARYYDPSIGRFTQMDTWQGSNSDPVTLHKYLYANVDPVNNLDPTGRFTMGGFSAASNIQTGLGLLQAEVGFNVFAGVLSGDTPSAGSTALGLAVLGGPAVFKLLRLTSSKFRKACNSFDGETLVATENGAKPISEIEIGDRVWAYNEATGETVLQEVVHLIKGDGEKQLIDITLENGETITTTAGHPFFVDGDWLEAGELKEENVLFTKDDNLIEIEDLSQYTQSQTVYNLTINNDHSYYVGESEVLSHNVGVCRGIESFNANHILRGDRGGGFHHCPRGFCPNGRKIIRFIRGKEFRNVDTPYKAKVFIPGFGEKTSSFFPQSWSRQDILNEVRLVHLRCLSKGNRSNLCIDFVSDRSFKIKVVLTPENGALRVKSAYPDI